MSVGLRRGLFGSKLSFSFSNWFCSPALGQTKYEILNRASAFMIKTSNPNSSFESKYHIVTSSHVVAPWRYPKYYPQVWLPYVNEDHIYCTVELRHSDGIFITQHDLHCISYHHPTRDLVVMHLQDEESQVGHMRDMGYEILELAGDDDLSKYGNDLLFEGHNVLGKVTEQADLRKPVPSSTRGRLIEMGSPQTFAKTQTILSEGMCGGPVILERPVSSLSGGEGASQKEKVICGIVEGIIPMDYVDPKLRGLAAFVPSHEIVSFIQEIEAGKVSPLKGGMGAFQVFKDATSEIDWSLIMDGKPSAKSALTGQQAGAHAAAASDDDTSNSNANGNKAQNLAVAPTGSRPPDNRSDNKPTRSTRPKTGSPFANKTD